MAKVDYNKGFKPYTITIENEAEHKCLTHLIKVRNDLGVSVNTFDPYVHPFGPRPEKTIKELLYHERVLLNNLAGSLPSFN